MSWKKVKLYLYIYLPALILISVIIITTKISRCEQKRQYLSTQINGVVIYAEREPRSNTLKIKNGEEVIEYDLWNYTLDFKKIKVGHTVFKQKGTNCLFFEKGKTNEYKICINYECNAKFW